jgi:hypothetical protein
VILNAFSHNRSNQVMKVLTVVGTVALPAVMISITYGMNVKGLLGAESPRALAIVFAVMVVTTAVLFLGTQPIPFVVRLAATSPCRWENAMVACSGLTQVDGSRLPQRHNELQDSSSNTSSPAKVVMAGEELPFQLTDYATRRAAFTSVRSCYRL